MNDDKNHGYSATIQITDNLSFFLLSNALWRTHKIVLAWLEVMELKDTNH